MRFHYRAFAKMVIESFLLSKKKIRFCDLRRGGKADKASANVCLAFTQSLPIRAFQTRWEQFIHLKLTLITVNIHHSKWQYTFKLSEAWSLLIVDFLACIFFFSFSDISLCWALDQTFICLMIIHTVAFIWLLRLGPASVLEIRITGSWKTAGCSPVTEVWW